MKKVFKILLLVSIIIGMIAAPLILTLGYKNETAWMSALAYITSFFMMSSFYYVKSIISSLKEPYERYEYQADMPSDSKLKGGANMEYPSFSIMTMSKKKDE